MTHLDAPDIRFIDVGPHFQPVQVDDGHECRGRECGRDGLADLGGHGGHDARDRGHDPREAQLDLGRLQCGLGLLDPRLRDPEGELGEVDFIDGYDLLSELALALVGGLRVVPLRLSVLESGHSLLARGLELGGVEYGQEVACLDSCADVAVKLCEDARDPRSDLDLRPDSRPDDPRGEDRRRQVPLARLHRDPSSFGLRGVRKSVPGLEERARAGSSDHQDNKCKSHDVPWSQARSLGWRWLIRPAPDASAASSDFQLRWRCA